MYSISVYSTYWETIVINLSLMNQSNVFIIDVIKQHISLHYSDDHQCDVGAHVLFQGAEIKKGTSMSN